MLNSSAQQVTAYPACGAAAESRGAFPRAGSCRLFGVIALSFRWRLHSLAAAARDNRPARLCEGQADPAADGTGSTSDARERGWKANP